MALVMMEAGPQVIVVDQVSGRYFFVDATVWRNFHKAQRDMADWVDGYSFALPARGESFTDNRVEPAAHPVVGEAIQEQDLIAQFTDFERNSGAMIVVCESDAEPRIIDKRRYKKLQQRFG